MTGCVQRRSPMRPYNWLTSRSDGHGQERRLLAPRASALLTAGRPGGYLTQYSDRTPRDLTSLSDEVLSFTTETARGTCKVSAARRDHRAPLRRVARAPGTQTLSSPRAPSSARRVRPPLHRLQSQEGGGRTLGHYFSSAVSLSRTILATSWRDLRLGPDLIQRSKAALSTVSQGEQRAAKLLSQPH